MAGGSKRLRIGIIDLVTKAPSSTLYGRIMHPNLASIMPQVIGVWCEEMGHDVSFTCFTGAENLTEELPEDTDILFISAFTQAAQLSYSISNLFRQRGAVTVLGGPHARCYPEDALKYFDYVVGFANRETIAEVVGEHTPHRPIGRHVTADAQPKHLPGVRERWKYVDAVLSKCPTSVKVVPMIGSLGCPYTCEFCIDSVIDYQPMDYDQIREDLKFVYEKMPKALVGWHDPNFGVRFDDYLTIVEEAIPPGAMTFVAESSLSLLAEPNVKRLSRAGFKAILPGIESWYTVGNKAKTGKKQGQDKVDQVSDHVNMILDHIPYLQANFVLGLDCDEGAEPFELTKRFIDNVPGAFPGYSLLSAFGEAAPLNLEYQKAGRVLAFPFHFLNNNQAMNVRPLNYDWPTFYQHVIDLTRYSFSWKNIGRRAMANRVGLAKVMNVVRAISSEGFGRLKYYRTVKKHLETDRPFRAFFEGETDQVPAFFLNRLQKDLGPMWEFLPEGSINHDPNAYLKKAQNGQGQLVQLEAKSTATA